MHGMRDVEVPANHGEMLQTTKPDAGTVYFFVLFFTKKDNFDRSDGIFFHLSAYFCLISSYEIFIC